MEIQYIKNLIRLYQSKIINSVYTGDDEKLQILYAAKRRCYREIIADLKQLLDLSLSE